jgi:hypothetical protein
MECCSPSGYAEAFYSRKAVLSWTDALKDRSLTRTLK